MDEIVLLPVPRRIEPLGGAYVGELTTDEDRVTIEAFDRREGYALTLNKGGITIEAADRAGAFYAEQTLSQLRWLATVGVTLPNMRITDWPDFAHRGVMLDISRDKVPTMATLRGVVDLLASLKLNQLQLYTEHTFAYTSREVVWQDASPMTPDQARELDAYCEERFIELVPNQNCFGHFERWLKHKPYADLAETPGGFVDAWNAYRPASTLNPLDERSIELVKELLTELLPCFTSAQVNIGCDETFELGKGRSASACAERGVGRVYLDHLLQVIGCAEWHGRTAQYWGDVVLEHPKLVGGLPRDAVALLWGYEADHPFDAQARCFAEAGVPFYICPGTSGWNSLLGRTTNMRNNITHASTAACDHGATGMLTTDWGDNGHWQPPPVSWAGYAWGAAMSWARKTNATLDLAQAIDLHVYRDRAGVMGQTTLGLGDAYRLCGGPIHNAAWPARLMYEPGVELPADVTTESLRAAVMSIDQHTVALPRAQMQRDDAGCVLEEWRLATDLFQHGCRLGIARCEAGRAPITALPVGIKVTLADELAGLIDRYEATWRQRNREGGLADSAGRLRQLLDQYRPG